MNYIFTDYECMKFNVLSHQTIGSCLIDNSKRDHIRQAKVSLQPKKIVMHEPIYYKCHTKYWWKQIILFAPHHLLFSKLTSVARKVEQIFYSSFFIFYFLEYILILLLLMGMKNIPFLVLQKQVLKSAASSNIFLKKFLGNKLYET